MLLINIWVGKFTGKFSIADFYQPNWSLRRLFEFGRELHPLGGLNPAAKTAGLIEITKF